MPQYLRKLSIKFVAGKRTVNEQYLHRRDLHIRQQMAILAETCSELLKLICFVGRGIACKTE
jgi:hypothetical protein